MLTITILVPFSIKIVNMKLHDILQKMNDIPVKFYRPCASFGRRICTINNTDDHYIGQKYRQIGQTNTNHC